MSFCLCLIFNPQNVQRRATVDTVFCPDLVSCFGFGVEVSFPCSPIFEFRFVCNQVYNIILYYVFLYIIVLCICIIFISHIVLYYCTIICPCYYMLYIYCVCMSLVLNCYYYHCHYYNYIIVIIIHYMLVLL